MVFGDGNFTNLSTVPRPISGQYQFQDSSNLFLFFSCENGSIIEPILSGESPTIYDYIPSFFSCLLLFSEELSSFTSR